MTRPDLKLVSESPPSVVTMMAKIKAVRAARIADYQAKAEALRLFALEIADAEAGYPHGEAEECRQAAEYLAGTVGRLAALRGRGL